jgi:Tfp pilus assembly protein PilV
MTKTRRRRGFALVHVIVTLLFVGAAALIWQASFQAMHARGVRGHDRARARAVAQAAWERARAALVAGHDATATDAPVLDGTATVRIDGAGPRRRVVIDAAVERRDGEPVRARLVLEVEVAPGSAQVRARSEGGA